MPTWLEEAKRLKDEAEHTHERMVDFARFAREAKRNIQLCDSELTKLSATDPRRSEIEEVRACIERSLARNRRMVEVGRLLLDGNAVIIESIEDGA